MKNSQQHLGNEANLTTFSLSHNVIFLMVSPLLGRFLVSFNLQSVICGLQSANVIHHIITVHIHDSVYSQKVAAKRKYCQF